MRALLPALILLAVSGTASASEPCVDVPDAGVCPVVADWGNGQTAGVVAYGPLWASVHADRFEGFFGTSTIVMAEAQRDALFLYWGGGFTDYDADNVPDDACAVCGGVVDEQGYLVSQKLAADEAGAYASLGVRHEGSLRGVAVGAYQGEPYYVVVLP